MRVEAADHTRSWSLSYTLLSISRDKFLLIQTLWVHGQTRNSRKRRVKLSHLLEWLLKFEAFLCFKLSLSLTVSLPIILLGAFNQYTYSFWPTSPKTAYFSSFEPWNLDGVILSNSLWFSKLKYLQLLIKNIKE